MRVAACACGYSIAAQPPPNWKTDWQATLSAAEQEGQLVIDGPRGRDQEGLYSEIFPRTFPKIRVQYTPGRLSQQIPRLMAVHKATSVVDLENQLRELGSSLDVQRTVFIERELAFGWVGQQVKEEKKPTHEELLAYYHAHVADWQSPAPMLRS